MASRSEAALTGPWAAGLVASAPLREAALTGFGLRPRYTNEQIDRRGRGAHSIVQLQDHDWRSRGHSDGARFRSDLNHSAWLVRS